MPKTAPSETRKAFRWIVVLVALQFLTACLSTPTTEEGDRPAEAAEGLEGVYAEVEGLTGDERRTALIALATGECDRPLSMYSTIGRDDLDAILAAFNEDTGLEVNVYAASAQDLRRRILQEEDAQIAEVSDVITSSGQGMAYLDREGIFAPLETPATEDNAVVHDTWAANYLVVYVAAWNTDNVPAGEEPDSWEEVFTDHPGGLAFQFDDVTWLATLVNDYYIAQKGMTEREAVNMIKDGVAQGAQVVDGHTLGAELLAAGRYDVASSLYQHRIKQLSDDGAPIAWEPAVKPLIVRSNGVGIHQRTRCPASALLLTEYMLTDMQPMLEDIDYTPAVAGVPGGLPAEYDPMPVNLDLLLDNQEKWHGYYDEITQAVGGEVIE